jgi:hypothetical protein
MGVSACGDAGTGEAGAEMGGVVGDMAGTSVVVQPGNARASNRLPAIQKWRKLRNIRGGRIINNPTGRESGRPGVFDLEKL